MTDLPIYSDCPACDVNEFAGSRTCSEHPDGPTFSLLPGGWPSPNTRRVGDIVIYGPRDERVRIVAFERESVTVEFLDFDLRLDVPYGALREAP